MRCSRGVYKKQVAVAVGKAAVGVVLIRVSEAGSCDHIGGKGDVSSRGKEVIGSDVADAPLKLSTGVPALALTR